MTDETRKVLLNLKARFEGEAAKVKKEADEQWRPQSQKDRAMTENVTFLWCANQIEQVLTEQEPLKQVCAWCGETIQEWEAIKGQVSHGICDTCLKAEEERFKEESMQW